MGGTYPWRGSDQAIQSSNVEQIVVLSDGWTSTVEDVFTMEGIIILLNAIKIIMTK